MKTQLTVAPMVAVALLTLSGPVLAQENSQAQLYGTLSAAVIHKTNQTGGSSASELANDPFAFSLFGIRGNEDLGGGMSATYRIESAISSDTGSAGGTVGTANKFWNRQSFVGLNMGRVVSVSMGRQFHASTDRVVRTLDVFNVGGSNLAVTPLALFGVNRFVGNDNRVDDSVKVRLNGPKGLQGGLSVGLDDGAGRSHAFDVAQVTPEYQLGAWMVNFRSPTVAATGQRPEHQAWGIGGNVPVGPVRVYLHYVDSQIDPLAVGRVEQRNKIVHLGANWQAAQHVSVRVGYYRDRGTAVNGVNGRDGTKTTWVTQAAYSLSKRTSLSLGFASNSFNDGYKLDPVNIGGLGRNAADSSTSMVSADIRHDF